MPCMIVVCVSLAVAGLAVLAALGARVFKEAGRLAAEVRSASAGIAEAARRLDEAARPLAARSTGDGE